MNKIIVNNIEFVQFRNSNYYVNKLGEVYNIRSRKVTNGCYDKNGYKRFNYNTKPRKSCSIHRAVLETYNPRVDCDLLEVNHINQIKDDNRLENLEWVTHEENMNKVFGSSKEALTFRKEDNPNSKLTSDQVQEILVSNKSYSSLAKIFGVHKSTIGFIKTGRSWVNK